MKQKLIYALLSICIVTAVLIVVKSERIAEPAKPVGEKIMQITTASEEETMSGPKVAITFDDGPSILYTKKLLDGLKERGVKATFFLIGKQIQQDTELVKRMYKEGHLIGNHTYSHTDLAKSNYNMACKEIEATNKAISEITGEVPKFIRPPYGDWDERLLDETNMSVVLWSVDPEDWKDQNADIVANRVIQSTRPGDIILLHDIFDSSVKAAFKIIDKLKEKGYQFVTIDQMDSIKIISKATYQNKK